MPFVFERVIKMSEKEQDRLISDDRKNERKQG